MADKKTARAAVSKPFLKGSPTDENTIRQIMKFLGLLILSSFMAFLVSMMASFNSDILRIAVNLAIEAMVLLIFLSRGSEHGTDAVARGEILYQHVQGGQEVSEGERRIPFNRMKGFVTGICGTVLFLIPTVIIALTAQKQMTGSGTLPSWMEGYLRRPEISGALTQYTQAGSVSVADILRILVRIMIMPFVRMAGAENRSLLLTVERISPLLVLLPAAAYGTGYLQGPSRRARIHSEISENKRRKISRERRERKARTAAKPKEPEQLN